MPRSRTYETFAPQVETLPSAFETSAHIVEEFSTNEDFLQELHDARIDTDDRQSYQYAHALSVFAEGYTKRQKEVYGTGDEAKDRDLSRLLSQVNLIASMPRMLHESEMVAAYEREREHGVRLNNTDWNDFLARKDYAITYNKSLSEHMYRYGQDTRFNDIVASLSDSARGTSPYNEEDIYDHVRSITRGARTEAISRQLFDKGHVPYRTSTVKEDARGGDLIALPKNKLVKTDLKTSPEPIAKLLGHGDIEEGMAIMTEKYQLYAITHHTRDKYPSITLYLGMTDEEIGDTCLLSDEKADEYSVKVAAQMMRAFIEMKL